MFRTNPDGMRMEPTPERVLSVCRLVAHEPMTRSEICNAMTLGNGDEKALDQIKKSIDVSLEELAVLATKDEKLILAVDSNVVASVNSFRRYVGSKVFSQNNTTFTMFTKWFIAQGEHVFSLKSWEGMAKTCGAEVQELSGLNENAVLGWRFWAAFLGLGYLSGTMMIPNMKLRIEDVLATSFLQRFKYDVSILARDFISWLSSQIPEVDMSEKLPLALSAGLRTLHELGSIKLETWRDSSRIKLYYVDGEPINEFSHITVKGAAVE